MIGNQGLNKCALAGLFMALLLFTALWGTPALAAPAATFSATASGTTSNLTLTASLSIGDADVERNGNIYLAALVGSTWYLHNGSTWMQSSGGPLPVYSVGPLTNRSIEVLRNTNLSAYGGTQIYVGYGRNESDMLTNGKYGLVYTVANAAPQGDWIDVHFHLIANPGDLAGFDEAARAALQIMDAERIRTIVVMSPPITLETSDFEILANIAKKYGPRIAIFGGGETLNHMLQEAGKSLVVTEEVRRRFAETAQHIIASGAKGFGEISAHHVSLTPTHPYESVPADHPLLLLLADIAVQHDVPIDLHFDPVPADVARPSSLSSLNPAVLKENLGGFERLLAHNRKAKIVWAHAGSDPVGYFTPTLVRELLGRHSNLALSIRPTGPYPRVMVHPATGAINAEWIAVLSAFPDRFVIGSDSFVVSTRFTGAGAASTFAAGSQTQRLAIRRLLSHLTADLARRIGYENAERIYRLNP